MAKGSRKGDDGSADREVIIPGVDDDSSDADGAAGAPAEEVLSGDELKRKGNEAFKKKMFAEAVDWYSRAVSTDPKNYAYLGNRCAALTAQAEAVTPDDLESSTAASLREAKQLLQRAIQDAKLCISLDRKWPKGYIRLGLAYIASADPTAAVRALKRGLDVVPGDSGLEQVLERARRELAAEREAIPQKRRRTLGNEEELEEEAERAARRRAEREEKRDDFLERSKAKEEATAARLREEGIILPKYNVQGPRGRSGYQPFRTSFVHKPKKRRRKRKRISAD